MWPDTPWCQLPEVRRTNDPQHSARRGTQRTPGPDEPDTAHLTYDLARILVRRGQGDQAFSLLDHALHHGLPAGMAAGLEKDPMLAPLHRDPRFATLAADARERAATSPN